MKMNFILAFSDAVPATEGAWTPSAIANLVTTLGFPIVVAYVVWVFLRARIETADKASERREEAAAIREAKMGERIDKLQDEIREELVTVVNKATDVMSETKECMSQCAGTLAACAVALGDMRDETKRQQRVGVNG